MIDIHNNESLRQGIYIVYQALFSARKTCPDGFRDHDVTRLMTGLMGSKPWSWRVVGITPAALTIFALNDFRRPTRQLQRGHLTDRVETARRLFNRIEPLPLTDFFDDFLRHDVTVIMLNAENTRGRLIPDYIAIDNTDAQLFPCGPLIGWQHRKAEVEFLRELHESRNGQK